MHAPFERQADGSGLKSFIKGISADPLMLGEQNFHPHPDVLANDVID